MNKKIAIVCSGGGMRCGYTGGVLVALAKELGLTSPAIVIGGSGGASSSLYYLTQQYEDIENAAVNLLSSPQLISLFRLRRIVDVDYLVDVIYKELIPLDLARLSLTKTAYYILVKNAENGNIHYYSNYDKEDVYEILRATTAAPYVYRKKIALGNSHYIDGASFSALRTMIDKAIELGADKVLVIDCRTLMSKLPKYKDSQVFVISNPKIPAKLLTRDVKKLQKTYDMGYSDVVNNKALAFWLKDPTTS
jgi:predicted patatin/cPLA2 family phospholipase